MLVRASTFALCRLMFANVEYYKSLLWWEKAFVIFSFLPFGREFWEK